MSGHEARLRAIWVTDPDSEAKRAASSRTMHVAATLKTAQTTYLVSSFTRNTAPTGPANSAVVFSDGDRCVMVRYEGRDLDHFVSNEGITITDFDQPPGPGFWSWEGELRAVQYWTDYGYEHDVDADGEWRELDPEEIDELFDYSILKGDVSLDVMDAIYGCRGAGVIDIASLDPFLTQSNTGSLLYLHNSLILEIENVDPAQQCGSEVATMGGVG